MNKTEDLPKRLMPRKQLPAYLKDKHGLEMSEGRFRKMAVSGDGPSFRKFRGRFAYYDPEEVDRWVRSMLSAPSQSSAGHRALAA